MRNKIANEVYIIFYQIDNNVPRDIGVDTIIENPIDFINYNLIYLFIQDFYNGRI